jgi:hypothetical protein
VTIEFQCSCQALYSPRCTAIAKPTVYDLQPFDLYSALHLFLTFIASDPFQNVGIHWVSLEQLKRQRIFQLQADQSFSSRISLISKSDIRYVGTLVEINSENSTVALEDVKSFGTEGRRSGEDEIPPSGAPYEYIIFRGSDVKDLRIEETPKETKPAPPPVPNDPAILRVSQPISISHIYNASNDESFRM